MISCHIRVTQIHSKTYNMSFKRGRIKAWSLSWWIKVWHGKRMKPKWTPSIVKGTLLVDRRNHEGGTWGAEATGSLRESLAWGRVYRVTIGRPFGIYTTTTTTPVYPFCPSWATFGQPNFSAIVLKTAGILYSIFEIPMQRQSVTSCFMATQGSHKGHRCCVKGV